MSEEPLQGASQGKEEEQRHARTAPRLAVQEYRPYSKLRSNNTRSHTGHSDVDVIHSTSAH